MSNIERSFRIISPEPEEKEEVKATEEEAKPKDPDDEPLWLVNQEEVEILPFNNYRIGNILNSAHKWDHGKKQALEWKDHLAWIEKIENNNEQFYLRRFNDLTQSHGVDVNKVRPILLTADHLETLFAFKRCPSPDDDRYKDTQSNGFIFTLFEYKNKPRKDTFYLCTLNCALLPGPATQIKYVHQLQNLYLDITGKEAFPTYRH